MPNLSLYGYKYPHHQLIMLSMKNKIIEKMLIILTLSLSSK